MPEFQEYDEINFENIDWQSLIHVNHYDEDSLRIIAKNVDLRVLLKTQTLTMDLIYELYLDPESNTKYNKTYEEECIQINEIIHYQKITREQIEEYVKKKNV